MATDYPEITALERALAAHQLELSVGAPDPRLQTQSYRRVHVATEQDGSSFSLAVDDEYDDATPGNQPLLLHLVLAECELYEESGDLLAWAQETGFDPAQDWVRTLYGELGEAVHRVRALVGSEVRALSSYDVSMNAGAVQALRGRSS